MISFTTMLILASCGMDQNSSFFRNADFNADWRFYQGEVDKAAEPDFNDEDWLPVHLPHDWSIIDYAKQDSLHQGPFFKTCREERMWATSGMVLPGTGRVIIPQPIWGTNGLSLDLTESSPRWNYG